MLDYQDFDYIDKILEKYKINPKSLYSDIGLSRQSWSGYKKSGAVPIDKALKIQYWLEHNTPHIALGGHMNKTYEDILKEEPKTEDIPNTKEKDNKSSIDIKLYDMSVSAGVGFEVDSIKELPFTRIDIDKSLFPNNVNPSEVVAMKVDGKSMIPTILPNEIVLYKENIGKYSGDSLYIVNFGGMLMVKRIQFNPELNKFDIISDNPSFKSYSVELTDENQNSLIIIGKIIATIQQ